MMRAATRQSLDRGPLLQRGGRTGASRGHRLVSVLLLFVLFLGMNLHVVVLQLYGWSNMTRDYRDTSISWVAAVDRALSKETSCHLCRTVDVAMLSREGVERSQVAVPPAELVQLPWLFLVPIQKASTTIFRPGPTGTVESSRATAKALFYPAEIPPPRAAIAG